MDKKIVTGRRRKKVADKQTVLVPLRLTPGIARSLSSYCRKNKMRWRTQAILGILQEKFKPCQVNPDTKPAA